MAMVNKVHRRLVTGLFAAVFVVALVSSILLSGNYLKTDDSDKTRLPLELRQTSFSDAPSGKLKAMLKGSIYETGEQMTLFGACFDGWGYLIEDPALNATLTSWYPDGTVWEQDMQMLPVMNGPNTTGRWRYQVNMGNVSGTYLTEITCRYQGDIAQAYGEWQNPDWVKRIKDTQDTLLNFENVSSQYYNNLTTQISNFEGNVQNNFTTVINMLNNITGYVNVSAPLVSAGLSQEDLTTLYNGMKQIDLTLWAIDTAAPYYTPFGGTANGSVVYVDMVSPVDVYIAGGQASPIANFAWHWDGETWVVLNTTSIDGASAYITGVSVVPAALPYAWFSTSAGYSVNGATPSTVSGASSQNFTAVRAFRKDVGSPIYAYLINDAGEIWFTNDTGVTWTNVATFDNANVCAPNQASISQVLWYGGTVQNAYDVMMTCSDDQVVYYNGTSYATISTAVAMSDAYLLTHGVAYTLETGTTSQGVYEILGNGTITQIYDGGVTPTMPELTSIVAAAPTDIWVGTSAPGGFYHYDGLKWEPSEFPFSAGVVINFGNLTVLPAITDMTLYDGRNAYAMSADGTVFKLYSNYNQRFDEIMTALANVTVDLTPVLNQLNQTYVLLNDTYVLVNNTYTLGNLTYTLVGDTYVLVNQTYALLGDTYVLVNQTNTNVLAINTTVTEIKDIVLSMNASIMLDLSDIKTQIANMNNSIQIKLDEILVNQTYMQLYLENTMFPMLNATYQNTLLILQDLGIIKTQLNETFILVNETKTGVDELVNKSRRMRAWITQ